FSIFVDREVSSRFTTSIQFVLRNERNSDPEKRGDGSSRVRITRRDTPGPSSNLFFHAISAKYSLKLALRNLAPSPDSPTLAGPQRWNCSVIVLSMDKRSQCRKMGLARTSTSCQLLKNARPVVFWFPAEPEDLEKEEKHVG
ncbi:hypothetical protein BaRGS_00015526, partial [Batillaria attramentaria]